MLFYKLAEEHSEATKKFWNDKGLSEKKITGSGPSDVKELAHAGELANNHIVKPIENWTNNYANKQKDLNNKTYLKTNQGFNIPRRDKI